MNETMMMQAAEMLRMRRNQQRWLAAVLALAFVIGLGTASLLSRSGWAMTHIERILTCPYAGAPVAHIHNDDCYDANGALACPLAETAEHIHGEACFDEEGGLICGQEERVLHIHGSGCFTEIELSAEEVALLNAEREAEAFEEPAEIEYFAEEVIAEAEEREEPARIEDTAEPEGAEAVVFMMGDEPEAEAEGWVFESELDGLYVRVEAEADAFPVGTTMTVLPVDDDEALASIGEAVEGRVTSIQAVSILFCAEDGEEIQPENEIHVTMASDEIPEGTDSVIVHLEDGAAEIVED